MNPKISVIIPVFRVEKYLPVCLDSLLRQTCRSLEIILVDDGSPDNCGEICDAYAQRDCRIQVIHQKNAGLSAARNTGLRAASGEYITFVDSDDWLPPHALETLYSGITEHQADCAAGQWVRKWHSITLPRLHRMHGPARCLSAPQAIEHSFLVDVASWNRLYRRETVKHILFPAGRINEDAIFLVRAYANCHKVVILPDKTYYYRMRSNSITSAPFDLRQMDRCRNALENLAYVKKSYPECTDSALYRLNRNCVYLYVHVCLYLLKHPHHPEAEKHLRHLSAILHTYKKQMMKNPHAGLAMKIMISVCASDYGKLLRHQP